MEGEGPKERKRPKTIIESKYLIIILIIVLIAVIFVLFVKIEEQEEDPLITFEENDDEKGAYMGIVQHNTDDRISDVSITIIDASMGESSSMDPITPENTLIVYNSDLIEGLNFTYLDSNQNDIIDKGDELIIRNVGKGDVILMIHKTGKSYFHYTF